MEGVIHKRITLPARGALFDGIGDFHRWLDKTEIKMGGSTTISHSACILFGSKRRFAAIGIGQVENIQVGMGFNSAWHHNFAISINRPCGLHRRIVDADVSNLLAADADRPSRDALKGYDLAVPDEQIQHGFSLLSLMSSSRHLAPLPRSLTRRREGCAKFPQHLIARDLS